MKRILLIIALFLSIASCKDDRHELNSEDNGLIVAFDKAKIGSIERDISYLPRWQDRIEFEGSYYIPLNTDKRIYSFTPDSVKYSLNGRIWLKAKKQDNTWNFTKLTVLPNDIQNSKGSGLFIYEDWKTGELSYEGYIENKLFSPTTYEVRLRSSVYAKKGMKNPNIPCKTVLTEVCAGEGANMSCTTRIDRVGNCTAGGSDGTGGGGSGGGGGGGGTVPPIIPPGTSEEDKEIIDSLQGYPCAQAILAQVPNLENEVSAWLNAVFNNNTDFNITFSDDPKLAGTKTDAEHRGFGSVNGQTHKITINPDVLNNASKEYIVATMFHEVLHGFLGSELLRLSAEGKANQFGVLYAGWSSVQINGQQRFVKNHASFGSQLDKLKKAIKSFNPNLSEYDALALAKNGIVTNLDAVETSLNDNHRRGKAGTKCTP